MWNAKVGKTSFYEKLLVSMVFAAAILIRLPGLGDSLWFDEIYRTNHMFNQPQALKWLLLSDVHPPLYNLILLGWTRIFGDSEIAVRIPPLVFGILSLFLIWKMARFWLGPRIAALSLILICVSPVHIWYSYENKNNMLLLLLSAAAFYFYWKATESNESRYWIFGTIALILAMWTHFYAFLYAACVAVWIRWRANQDNTILKPAIISLRTICLCVIPLLVLKLYAGGIPLRDYMRPFTLTELYKYLLIWLPHGNTIRTINAQSSFAQILAQPWIYLLLDSFYAALLICGLVQTIKMALRAHDDSIQSRQVSKTWIARLLLIWSILPLIAAFAISLFFDKFYVERNLIALVCPFALIMCIGIFHLRCSLRIATCCLYLVLSVVALLNLYIFKADQFTVAVPKPDWRGAMKYLIDEIRSVGDVILVQTVIGNELDYYANRMITKGEFTLREIKSLSALDFCSGSVDNAKQRIYKKGISDAYLVWNKTRLGCFDEAMQAISGDSRFRQIEIRQFRGMNIYKYRMQRDNGRHAQR